MLNDFCARGAESFSGWPYPPKIRHGDFEGVADFRVNQARAYRALYILVDFLYRVARGDGRRPCSSEDRAAVS